MAKIKLGVLVGEEFQVCMAHLMACAVPMRAAYDLIQIAEKVAGERSKYEMLRKGLLEKYGEKTPEGTLKVAGDQYVISDRAGFDSEFADLLGLEVEIPTVPLDQLGAPTIKPAVLAVLLKTVVTG